VTQHFPTRQIRFYLTAPAPCPYLPDRLERKVFAHLPLTEGAQVNDSLTQSGFRRSQNIAYRPACETCAACVSVRIPVADHRPSRSDRKTLNRNGDRPPASSDSFDAPGVGCVNRNQFPLPLGLRPTDLPSTPIPLLIMLCRVIPSGCVRITTIGDVNANPLSA
jgi:arginyl-tRNA--protein-N-Asp/Glu arginylyltransferase